MSVCSEAEWPPTAPEREGPRSEPGLVEPGQPHPSHWKSRGGTESIKAGPCSSVQGELLEETDALCLLLSLEAQPGLPLPIYPGGDRGQPRTEVRQRKTTDPSPVVVWPNTKSMCFGWDPADPVVESSATDRALGCELVE